MEHIIIEYDCECTSCKATGLYIGLGERDGAAVVCFHCNGTGKVHRVHKYNDFLKRKAKSGVKRVYKANPGMTIGTGNGYILKDFGGMPYELWDEGQNFPKKSENRKFTCPAWWYQSADYDKKPNWDECAGCGAFSDCKHFKDKSKCWERFDEESRI